MTEQQQGPTRRLRRYGYGATIATFLNDPTNEVVGRLTRSAAFSVEQPQVLAWEVSIESLRGALGRLKQPGHVYLEFDIPRLGRRVDAVAIIGHVIFVIEFKVGAAAFLRADLDQVVDYALDLKHFHESSHHAPLVPILIATDAATGELCIAPDPAADGLFSPVCCADDELETVLAQALVFAEGPAIVAEAWVEGRYRPTPTIVEAAMALYARHSVTDISRNDAANLGETSAYLNGVIAKARSSGTKAICLVTGVPGAGKTLVGLDVATHSTDAARELHAVYLSGNDPLVRVLQEALARDRVRRESDLRIGKARREVKSFVQNVHHFRDEALRSAEPPYDHVAIFDEAQRAWDAEMTADFMKRKKGLAGFDQSEPEFLISYLDRHPDSATVICLVGTGQEINRGEAGISEWMASLNRRFQNWNVHVSPELVANSGGAAKALEAIGARGRLHAAPALHLRASLRSFRSERLSDFVNRLIDLDVDGARALAPEVLERFPMCLTRNLSDAKRWLRHRARGTERYGMVVSSQAQRLKPHAIDVRVKVDPVHWFLAGKDDTRSSYYLEDVATEFQVQGLELDWTCVVWDGDLRVNDGKWAHFSFKGERWERINKRERQAYLENAYRVLLTRARQGTVLVVPEGDQLDPTRAPSTYDPIYDLLQRVGLRELSPSTA
ncbi:DUF2075 domain-containing protein [Lysobacter humi (ex Lee et al. 2017)]